MFFKKHVEPKPLGVEEELEILSNRLDGSMYHEDRVDALNRISEISEAHPVETGVYALQNVLHSMAEMEDVSVHLSVANNVFRCTHRLEFIDITVKSSETLKILFDCIRDGKRGGDVYDLLCLLSVSESFPSRAAGIPNIAYYCVQMVRDGRMGLIPRLVDGDLHFKKELTFMGVFEELLRILDERFLREAAATLQLLLRDCPFNQNYFDELKWGVILKHVEKHADDVFGVLTALIDLKNIEFGKLQCSVHRKVELGHLVRLRRWYLLYLVVKDNLDYTKELLDASALDSISEDLSRKTSTRRRNEMYLLVDYLLLHSNFSFSKVDSYKIYTMKTLREQIIPTDSLVEKAFGVVSRFDSERRDVVFDALVFIIFNFEAGRAEGMISLLSGVFGDYTKPKLHRFLCLVVLLMLEAPVEKLGINRYTAAHLLRETRALLISIDLDSEFYLTDEMVDLLTSSIGDLINVK